MSFSILDKLFVTIRMCGVTCLCRQVSGITSFGDLLTLLKPTLEQHAGLATIHIRNATSGVCTRQSILLR